MRSAHLDVTLATDNAQCRLRSEVDELATEVALVLRYVLVQRGRQSRIVPGGGLGIVVHKVYSGCVGEAHFPSGRQRPKLRDGLLLDCASVGGLTTVHPNVLLSARIHPCCRSRVVINKVWPALGGMPLLPTRWELSCSSSSRSCRHHACSVG